MLRKILLVLGYVGLTALVVGVTVALVAYGNDYSYDFTTHKIIQKGHVIIQSAPSGVVIIADGKTLHKKTPYQAAYKVGQHNFSLSKAGYWPWQKMLQVVAGQVSLAEYVILVPKHPATTVLDSRTQIVAQAISKDHRHLAYITGGPDSALYTLDLGNPTPVKLYTPAAATATAGAETLTGITWSDDASHLLLSSTLGGQPKYRLLSAGGGTSFDLTGQYQENFTGLQFSSGNWQQLYWISADGLRRLDVGAQSISGVLADHVTQFWVISNRVLYTQQTSLGQSLWSVDSHDKHQELIPALPASPSYAVAYTTYLDQDELAVVPAATETGTLYSDIFSDTPVAKTIAHGVTGASFSPDGHVVAFTGPSLIVTYDLEASQIQNRLVRYDIADEPGTFSTLTWFDDYHMLVTRGNQLYWCEFDGANRVALGAVATGLPAYSNVSSNPKALVEFAAAAAGVRITQVQILPSGF
jgi:PEGA domain-containing protein